jgi:hypothetical protein
VLRNLIAAVTIVVALIAWPVWAQESKQESPQGGERGHTHVPIPAAYAGAHIPTRVWTDPKMISKGKEIYAAKCALCHGERGDGKGPAGVSLTTGKAQHVPARGLSDVLALAASPDPTGPLLAGKPSGLLMSRDGGLSWTRVSAAPTGVAVTSAAYHTSDARVAYTFFARPGPGLMRSRDGGSTWEPAGLPAESSEAAAALVVGPGDQVVAATTSADILRSSDGGRTWQVLLRRGRVASPSRR